MSKRLSIVSMAVALPALFAITAALALSNKPAPVTYHAAAASSIPGSAAQPAAIMAKQGPGDTDGEVKDDHEGNDGDTEKDDDGNLTASITPAQATASALAAYPGGAAGKPELESENGTAVYGVAVTAADGKKYDVKVDANTGKVLKSEADDESGSDKEDESDGDGETNDDGK